MYLSLQGLHKRFGEYEVLRDISLEVAEGETLVLLGPSGSGKTTLLRTIAGFEPLDGGRLMIAGEDITHVSPAERRFGMVFQHYALFPHMSVGQNVAFGLGSQGVTGEAAARRVEEVLALVDLPGFDRRKVHEISGGQQQRVALARALAPQPRVLLLDEPLSNLDPTLREQTRSELKSSLQRIGITAIWVTHEQEEAFDVGSRVAVLHQGRLQQVGTPEELYSRPANRFVAGFVGRASSLRGRLRPNFKVALIEGAGDGSDRELLWSGEPVGLGEEPELHCDVELVVRPEALELCEPDLPQALAGAVTDRRYGGSTTFYGIELDGGEVVEVAGGPRDAQAGDRVGVKPRDSGGTDSTGRWIFRTVGS